MKSPVAIAATGIVVSIVVFAVVFLLVPEPDRLALLSEIARIAIGIVPVAFFGVIIAELVKERDQAKARREQRVEQRRAFRARAIDAYNKSKATRRTLRGAGLRPDSGSTLDGSSLAILDEQIGQLIGAQLTFEHLKREVRAPGAPFDDSAILSTQLEHIEKYLNRVIKDWEVGRPNLTVGSPVTQLEGWAHYRDFVAAKDAARLADSPTEAFKAFELAIAGELST